jgi:hypothetical protein
VERMDFGNMKRRETKENIVGSAEPRTGPRGLTIEGMDAVQAIICRAPCLGDYFSDSTVMRDSRKTRCTSHEDTKELFNLVGLWDT